MSVDVSTNNQFALPNASKLSGLHLINQQDSDHKPTAKAANVFMVKRWKIYPTQLYFILLQIEHAS